MPQTPQEIQKDQQAQERYKRHIKRKQRLEKLKKIQKDLEKYMPDEPKSIEIDPEDSIPYTGRAWVKYLTGDFEGAIRDSRKALTFNPKDFSALSTLGRSQYALDQKKVACSNLKKAISIGTNDLGGEADSYDYLQQNTKYYLASEEGSWCRNMLD